MSRYTEILNLNTDDVSNIADAYTGYAEALSERAETQKLPFAASCWLIGALYKAILAPQQARDLFARSSEAYRQLGMPIWRLCSICAQNNSDRIYSEEIPLNSYDDEDSFYANLQRFDYSQKIEGEFNYTWGNENERPYSGRVPGLNIPYSLVLQVLNDTRYGVYTNKFSGLDSFSNLLERLGELTELYQSDEYHWENLEGAIVPFEPAALAIVIVALKTWLRVQSYDMILSRLNKLDQQQTVLLNIAHDILQPNKG
ncbi:hypothetical protein BDD43_3702 [Mucilaginibacter gracilis]|uniref:Immunity protein 49 of polymorphic toxin system n=1 Tax=Mucilaginibacter gracilis TaxID=423350 RepID=A0A495J4G9_9SPHI|nr:hypothetical protein [Mucilaginibacter gracilis]RKR83492.1 hypothetical protein BDD43_3702 [Mucilaginibacter gracilis]